jgi:hypothetical protein
MVRAMAVVIIYTLVRTPWHYRLRCYRNASLEHDENIIRNGEDPSSLMRNSQFAIWGV